MKTVTVNTPSHSYPVHIGAGLLESVGLMLSVAVRGKKAAVVTDERVATLYLEPVLRSLERADLKTTKIVLPQGEGTKSMDTLSSLYTFFSESGITRTDAVIALGGGVIGDVAGFAAATWQRGVPLMQIPTTLLAQVDSSVGGKTAVNLPEGKNLAGVFYQPSIVVTDTSTLKTLSAQVFNEGMAEVIKYGCIKDPHLLDVLDEGTGDIDLPWVIERCVAIKRDVVESDERDTGEREILNFGHTAGHACESLGGYKEWSHGEGVAMGMVIASKLGVLLGITPEQTTQRIESLLKRYGLPVECPYGADQMMDYIFKDKKMKSGKLSYVLLKELGEAVRVPMDEETLKSLYRMIAG